MSKAPMGFISHWPHMSNLCKRFLLGMMLVFASTLTYAQTEITGTVVDETGEGVIGATIMEKGTSNGTVTDLDGNFTLKVEPGKTLVITYIGYDAVEVAAAPNLNISLKENANWPRWLSPVIPHSVRPTLLVRWLW